MHYHFFMKVTGKDQGPFASDSSDAGSRATAMTGAPASAKALAMPRPRPRLAPMTIAVLPAKSPMGFSGFTL